MRPATVRSAAPRLTDLCLLASVLMFVVLFWRLGGTSFWDPDEAHYAQTSREMVERGDWLAPYYNDAPFFDKPALFHVLQAGAMRVFGPTEFAARLVPSLAALTLIGITAWVGAALISVEVGIVAGLLLAMSPGSFGLARYAILDTLFTAFMFGGAALLTVAALRDRPRLQYPGYVLIALAVLTKGPLALVLCGLTLFIASAFSVDARRRLWALHWVWGLGLILAIAAPWFIYMFVRFGDPFVQGYVLDENLRLYATSRFANQPGPSFYLRILAVGLLPWTGLVSGRLVDDIRAARRGEKLDTVEIVLWSWVLAVVGFFSFSVFKLDHYVFAAAPAFCLLGARTWSDVRADRDAPRHAWARFGLRLVGPLLIVIGVGAGVFLLAQLELPRPAVIVPLAIAVAGILLTARAKVLGDSIAAIPAVVTVAMTIMYAGIVGFAIPAVEARKVVPDVARWVSARAGTERVASYRLNRWEPAFRFYVGRHTAFLNDPSAIQQFVAAPEPFYVAMTRDGLRELEALGLPLKVVYERDGMWATSGRVLWRRRLPPTQFIVVTRAS